MSFYNEYWGELLDAMRMKKNFPLMAKKTSGDNNWLQWECFGRKGFKLLVSLRQDSDWICVNFGIDSKDQKHHFASLKRTKSQIENSFGSKLRWEPLGNERSKTQAIYTKYGLDVQDRDQWAEQHAWILSSLEKMYFAFKPHIEALDKASTAEVIDIVDIYEKDESSVIEVRKEINDNKMVLRKAPAFKDRGKQKTEVVVHPVMQMIVTAVIGLFKVVSAIVIVLVAAVVGAGMIAASIGGNQRN